MNFPLFCLEPHVTFFFQFAGICHLEIWISKIARIADQCTSCLLSLLPSVVSNICWWKWCNEEFFNFLQEQFSMLLCCYLQLPRESLAFCSDSMIH